MKAARKAQPARAAADPAAARLIWKASPLIAVITQLRVTPAIADLGQLHSQIAAMLVAFMDDARAGGIGDSRATQATEVLAALADHVVSNMPWGVDAGWHNLSQSAASRGEKPVQRLLTIAAATSQDAGLQELIGVTLLVGFDKRSRGKDDAEIEQLLARAAQVARTGDGEPGKGAVPFASGRTRRIKGPPGWLPLWVCGITTAAALAVLTVVLLLSLAGKSDAIYAHLAALRGPAVSTPRPLPAPTPRLASLLAEPIAAQSMSVRDEIDRSVIVVPEGRLFAPGESTASANSNDSLQPIAAALKQTPGRIQVIGHTDSTETRSARFASDWDLSVERARVVRDALRTLGVDAARTSHDGHASVEPLPADDPARAISGDGRIEIVLLAGR
ncbi:MAG: DotU family type IV/VI secretion system protein [Proteobacteria bacterium]|nr:DotU family type IV/VI secretion system protein [Pseudomonadota bacterium]